MLNNDFLLSVSEIKELLTLIQVSPSKDRGQNFLIDATVVDAMIEALGSANPVLEIGCGLGALTLPLAHSKNEVHVIEVEKSFATIVNKRLDTFKLEDSVTFHIEDILDYNLHDLNINEIAIISSLPYSITSPILHKLSQEYYKNWKTGVFLMQKEVAEKITTDAPHASYWSLYMKAFYDVKRIGKVVTPASFWPQPGVKSSVLQFSRHDKYDLDPTAWSTFLHTVFSQPRKKLTSVIRKEVLLNADISPDKRAQELTLDDALRLFKKI